MNRDIALDGVTLHTRIDGPEGAPWMILSNSLGADLTMWDEQIPFLTEKFRVLRYDTRGHGKSSVPEGPYSLDQLTGDVLSMMDNLGIGTAHFMGLSMGGMTGLGLGLRAPERFVQIICADGRADAPEGFRTMWDTRIAAVEAGGLEAILDGTMGSWFTPDWAEANPARAQEVSTMILANDPAGYIGCCRALQGLDYLRSLGDMTVPVLYVGGDQDKGAAPEVMQAMADATPGGVYVQVADAAHVANVNRPDAFNAAIAEVLGL
jgi:3-oxoadipate enol-lactonase